MLEHLHNTADRRYRYIISQHMDTTTIEVATKEHYSAQLHRRQTSTFGQFHFFINFLFSLSRSVLKLRGSGVTRGVVRSGRHLQGAKNLVTALRRRKNFFF